MFEYNGYCIVVYGFKKIEYLDENKIIFKYKKRKLFVNGKCLKAFNFMIIKIIINHKKRVKLTLLLFSIFYKSL